MLFGLDNVTLTLGGKTLFGDVSLRLGEAERVGLIGPNGSGKTSLLRLLAGELDTDSGSVHARRGLRVGYLPQDPIENDGKTLLELVRERLPGRTDLDEELHRAEQELADGERNGVSEEELLEAAQRVADLHERLAHFEADYADHVALRILAGLGFSPGDAERDVGELSGGWQMRGVLASLLFTQPDLLLLDEPTNHLDMPAVAWFSNFLRNYPRSFILISHDREFLNEQIQRVISFEPEGVRSYTGDYESYREQRAEEAEILQNRQKNLQREREKAEQFINRFRYQATKAKAVQSRVKALERMERVDTVGAHAEVSFTFPPTERTSKLVLSVRGLNKSFGDLEVLRDVQLSLTRGERVAIIGVNGAGKTTLLKTIAGELQRDSGEVDLGHHVRLGYYAQHHAEMLTPASTIFEEVARSAQDKTPTQVRTLLGALLFSGDDVDKQVRVLSGGERARVALAKLLIAPHNLLLMDEPTNHLDLASSERLAEALTTYDGSLLFVSHNRSFVRRLATRIWNVRKGTVEAFPGGLDDYLTSATRQLGVEDEVEQDSKGTDGAAKGVSAKERRRQQAELRARKREKLGGLQDRLAELETEIGELEALQAERSVIMEDPNFYLETEHAGLVRDFGETSKRLEELTAAWERAGTELEEAERVFAEEEAAQAE